MLGLVLFTFGAVVCSLLVGAAVWLLESARRLREEEETTEAWGRWLSAHPFVETDRPHPVFRERRDT
jgi:hypothetical protein